MDKPLPTPEHFRRMAALSHEMAQVCFKVCALWEEVDEEAMNAACGPTFLSCVPMCLDELSCQWLGAHEEWLTLAAYAEAEAETK